MKILRTACLCCQGKKNPVASLSADSLLTNDPKWPYEGESSDRPISRETHRPYLENTSFAKQCNMRSELRKPGFFGETLCTKQLQKKDPDSHLQNEGHLSHMSMSKKTSQMPSLRTSQNPLAHGKCEAKTNSNHQRCEGLRCERHKIVCETLCYPHRRTFEEASSYCEARENKMSRSMDQNRLT